MRGAKPDLKPIDGGLKGAPPVPGTIPAVMADEWKAIAAEMVERKILSTTGLGLVETYILARWTVREAQKAIEAHGVLVEGAHKAPKPNPACAVLVKAMEQVTRLGGELGLTPSARSKQGFQPKGGQPNEGAPTGLDI